MVDTFSHLSLNAEVRTRFQDNAHNTCCGQIGSETGLSPNILLFSCYYHSTNAPHSSSSTYCSYLVDKRAKIKKLPKEILFRKLENTGQKSTSSQSLRGLSIKI
jgi:hypothetical protein